jgi:hypothetical protein
MKYLVTIFLFCALSNAKAQGNVKNDTLHWNVNKPLTWNDFKGDAIEGIGLVGEVFCMNLANFERANAFQKTKFKVVAIFDRTKSWIEKDAKVDQALLYFQVMFNIYEVHARALRKDLATSKFGYDPTNLFQEKYNNSMTNLTNEFNQYRKETKMGIDSTALVDWKIKVELELNDLKDFRK